MIRQIGSFSLLLASTLTLSSCATLSFLEPESPQWRLAIHGGAGVLTKNEMTPETEKAYLESLQEALDAGAKILSQGGTSLDAVEAAVVILEDNPLFNAGKGAVFTEVGAHELDASIMNGADRNAGSVAGVTRVKNPILAARAVMEHSLHTMFSGTGADTFATSQGLALVDPEYFDTEKRRDALHRVLKERARKDSDVHGTVGAVAIDLNGDLAAATSTGGMTAKAAGRVGDSPIIGAATYAQNDVCAVSSTGHGEYFIRVGVAKAICTRMQHLGEDPEDAAAYVLGEVSQLGGTGGVIVLNGDGEVGFTFTSKGMYRGLIDAKSSMIAIYGD